MSTEDKANKSGGGLIDPLVAIAIRSNPTIRMDVVEKDGTLVLKIFDEGTGVEVGEREVNKSEAKFFGHRK